jgi:hypothetical protein
MERSGTQHSVVRGAKQMTADTKKIVYLAVHGQESSRLPGRFESAHLAFPLALVRDLRSIVCVVLLAVND